MEKLFFMTAAIRFIDWLGGNGSMSRQRLGFASEQGVEVIETLIGSPENVEVIEILPCIRSRRDPNSLMSVVIGATQPFPPNEKEISHGRQSRAVLSFHTS